MDADFPPELFKLILSQLDKQDLKQCLILSKSFRELLIQTPACMRKLELIFFNDRWKSKVAFAKNYGNYVRNIKFDDCGFREDSDIRKILRLTPNVEKLTFYNCYTIEAIVEEGQPPHAAGAGDDWPELNAQPNQILSDEDEEALNNLNELSIDDDDSPLTLKKLNFLHLDSCNIAESLVKDLKSCTTLKSFKATFYYQTPIDYFTSFLCQQNDLQELHLVGWSDMVFKSVFKDRDICERIKFKLRKFSLECEMSYHENFTNFFRSQAPFVKELELTCYNINFNYYRLLFKNFHSLQKLTLPIDWFLTDERVADIQSCRIPSLRELELVGSNDDITIFETVMNIFPNIEVLRAENLMYFCMHEILEPFVNLRYIKAENFRMETMLFVSLPSLKHLEINCLYPMAQNFFWEKLTEHCPNIEELVINDIVHFKLAASIKREISIIVRNLAKLKNLRRCEIISNPQEPMVNVDENGLEVQHEHPFFKIVIDCHTQKVIRVSEYFAQNCVADLDILKDVFNKCDIVEI